MSAPTHAVSLQDSAATIAEVEHRLSKYYSCEQDSVLRTVHRRYIELNELLESAENYGDLAIKRGLLLGKARSLKLSATSEPGKLLNVDISKAASEPSGTFDASSPHYRDICSQAEQKRDSVLSIPGIHSLAGYPTEEECESEQCKLLTAHIRYLGELVSEAMLLSALCQHKEDHPVYQVASGLEKYFGGLIYSLSLKLKIMSADMYQTLYSKETLAAMERLRGMLEAKEAELLKDQALLDERLTIYRDAGSEFQEIAAAYSAVLEETEQIRQDIARVSRL